MRLHIQHVRTVAEIAGAVLLLSVGAASAAAMIPDSTSLLGTMYGGDGKTTFALPNLKKAAPNGLTYSICQFGIFP